MAAPTGAPAVKVAKAKERMREGGKAVARIPIYHEMSDGHDKWQREIGLTDEGIVAAAPIPWKPRRTSSVISSEKNEILTSTRYRCSHTIYEAESKRERGHEQGACYEHPFGAKQVRQTTKEHQETCLYYTESTFKFDGELKSTGYLQS